MYHLHFYEFIYLIFSIRSKQVNEEKYFDCVSEPLEYSLDNANPGFYDGDGLLGNEDDSVSWYIYNDNNNMHYKCSFTVLFSFG